MILKKKFYHIHVVLILSLNFSVTKWNLLSCYFLEITNSDKQNLKWKTTKLFVNLLKLLRPYFCVSKEMQRTLKKERSFRVITDFLRWDSEVYFYSTYHKKGIVWLELCIDVSGESTLHVRVKLLLGLWTSISKAAYRWKPCTLIMNENNEQPHQE